MHPGAEADVVYRVYNDTGEDIKPAIVPDYDIDTSRYSYAEAYSAKPELAKLFWLSVPKAEKIEPNNYRDFIVSLQIPKKASIPEDRFAYLVGVSGNTGGIAQTAVSVWWLINMR
jgi:hypothetical protein